MLLLDGDIFAYRVAWAREDESDVTVALTYLDEYIFNVMMEYPEHDCLIYLTGKGNFRNEVATYAPYKGNRRNTPRPQHLPAIREHMIEQWGALVTEGEEADDAIAIDATSYKDSIMVSIDKDFNQVAGLHYDFVKGVEYVITEEEGLKLFYKQILTGDAVDNIFGVYLMGDAGAMDLIHGCRNENDMWDIVRDQLGDDRALENARLLWLRREAGQLWLPPTTRPEDAQHYGAYTKTTH